MSENRGEMLIYQTEDGMTKIDVIISACYRVKSQRGVRFQVKLLQK